MYGNYGRKKEMKFRKGFSIILTAVMVLTLGVSGSYAETPGETGAKTSEVVFTDISGHWAEEAIKEAASLGITGGYLDGTYLPDNLIKREEFYKLLTNILTEKPDTTNTKIQFTDVVDYEWYVPTIKIAVASGITSGYGDGRFGIGLMISRQEAAKVAGSVIPTVGDGDEEGAETARDKAQIADWAYQYVDIMFKKGYMKGDTEGNFRPTMALTRAEAATILLNVKKNEPIIVANAEELATTDCMAAHAGQEGVFVQGSGTKNDPYKIATEEQLNHMRIHVTEGAFYVLTKNIAITKDYAVTPPAVTSDEANWTQGNFAPIGSKEVPFKGSLFGNGYTISGLNITGSAERDDSRSGKAADYAGLFGCLAEGSGVTNLIIDASNIEGGQYTGGIVGYNEGTIMNCQLGSKGKIKGSTYTGGIVGFSTSPLSSLRNRGSVEGSTNGTGGIVGFLSASETALLNCQNEGVVKGNKNTGGIVGILSSGDSADTVVRQCDNKGTVEVGPYNGGGIAGAANSGGKKILIEDCENSGYVDGSGVNGGIVGYIDEKVTVNNCTNIGDVTGDNAGGVLGENGGVISYCYNTAKVSGSTNGGGIAAYQSKESGKITKCYNQGLIDSENNSGGITGSNEAKINNCYNTGKIRGTNYIGGIAGKNIGSIKNTYNAGTLTGENGEGSLVGRNTGTLTDSYWLAATAAAGVGLSENAGSQSLVATVTHEELSGQKKIMTSSGYKLLVNVMNENNATSTDSNLVDVWEYLYTPADSASDGSAVISDGGGIVPPLEINSTDSTGNTIKEEDLNVKYLYPSIIKF